MTSVLSTSNNMTNMGISSGSDTTLDAVPFGRPMRDTHFLFSPSHKPLNHGSFGTYPRYVQRRLRELQDQAELRPDVFMRIDYPRLLDESRMAMAEFLSVPVDELVFVSNTTTAVDTVVRNLVYEEGDVVVHFSTMYTAIQKLMAYMSETTALRAVNIELVLPKADDEVVDMLRTTIRDCKANGKRVRFAIFDTITSLPGLRQPWERLCAVCKEEGVLSLVDGAHGIGHIDIDLNAAQPDFFVSNLHKWLFVPRGCALFYVPTQNQHLIRTCVPTSHGFNPLQKPGDKAIFNPLASAKKAAFPTLFEFTGTKDNAPFMCVVAALEFRRRACGGEIAIKNYCLDLANNAGKLLAKQLGTTTMKNAQQSSSKCALTNVKLPLTIGQEHEMIEPDDVFDAIEWMSTRLLRDFDTYIVVFEHGGCLWMRLSAQVYLELADLEQCAGAILDICKSVKAGAYKK